MFIRPDTEAINLEGARWSSGRASEIKSRGPVFEPHRRHCVVSLCKTRKTH